MWLRKHFEADACVTYPPHCAPPWWRSFHIVFHHASTTGMSFFLRTWKPCCLRSKLATSSARHSCLMLPRIMDNSSTIAMSSQKPDGQNSRINAKDADKLIETITSNYAKLSLDDPEANNARLHVISACESLIAHLETPTDTARKLASLDAAVIRSAIDLQIFEILYDANSPISTFEVAYQCHADIEVLERVLQYLSSIQIITKVGPKWTIWKHVRGEGENEA